MDAKQNNNYLLDIVKFVCSILIVGSHTLPLVESNVFNYYYGQYFFRFCVPLFFVSSGYFFQKMSDKKKRDYIKRILFIYLIGLIIYSPFFIKDLTGLKCSKIILQLIRKVLFGYHHLWYLIALFFSLVIVYFFERNIKITKFLDRFDIPIAIFLLFSGAFFDEYSKLFYYDIITFLNSIIYYIGTSRNFLFMAFPLLLIGRHISKNAKIFLASPFKYYIAFFIFSLTSLFESIFLYRFIGNMATNDLTFTNTFPAIFLFIITFYYKSDKIQTTKNLRKTTDIIYLIHPLVVSMLRIFTNLQFFLLFVVATLISIGLSMLILKAIAFLKAKITKVYEIKH